MKPIETVAADDNGEVIVAALDEFPAGARKIVSVERAGKTTLEIGVFNVGGVLVAYRNVCPHAGAPVCQGTVCGTTFSGDVGEFTLARQGEILRCPWHGWEFDLLTGAQLVDAKMKLKSYAVDVQIPALDAIEVVAEAGRAVLKLR